MNYLKRNSLVVGIATALSVSAMADSSMLNLDVKAQNAGSALLDIGEKAGVQIMISPELGRNLQLPGINGQYTLAEALDYMLEGTGLSYEMTSDNLVTVHADDDSVSDDEEEAKEADEEVVITGSRLKNISSGS
ncbi:MAG: STN domain-containing protein, partial [Porticoccaceae bacterium]|nr:STN domain-containing protein [Porticoccaceae bacterium]